MTKFKQTKFVTSCSSSVLFPALKLNQNTKLKNAMNDCNEGMQSCIRSFCPAVYRRQLTHQSRAERGFKGRCMTAASFDVDGICTPVCILKGSKVISFNVCLLTLTLLDDQIRLCTPYCTSTAQCLLFEPYREVIFLISVLYLRHLISVMDKHLEKTHRKV